jgi:hypothetical protein
MNNYHNYVRNTPESFMPTGLNEFKVGGLRDSVPPPKVRVYKVKPDGSKGELIREENGDTFEHYKDTRSFNWGHLGNMSEADGSIKTNG